MEPVQTSSSTYIHAREAFLHFLFTSIQTVNTKATAHLKILELEPFTQLPCTKKNHHLSKCKLPDQPSDGTCYYNDCIYLDTKVGKMCDIFVCP